jgi:hypothetical protein
MRLLKKIYIKTKKKIRALRMYHRFTRYGEAKTKIMRSSEFFNGNIDDLRCILYFNSQYTIMDAQKKKHASNDNLHVYLVQFKDDIIISIHVDKLTMTKAISSLSENRDSLLMKYVYILYDIGTTYLLHNKAKLRMMYLNMQTHILSDQDVVVISVGASDYILIPGRLIAAS